MDLSNAVRALSIKRVPRDDRIAVGSEFEKIEDTIALLLSNVRCLITLARKSHSINPED